MSQIRKTILPIFFLTLFMFYHVSATMFTHAHYINGVLLVHSHPSTQRNHTHTNGQLIIIDRLNVFHALEVHFANYAEVYRSVIWRLEKVDLVTDYFPESIKSICLRAPPNRFF